MLHQGKKDLVYEFDAVCQRLESEGVQTLRTSFGSDFSASAGVLSSGSNRGKKVIRISSKGRDYAHILHCCWRHTTTCTGGRIGGYSDSLDKWMSSV